MEKIIMKIKEIIYLDLILIAGELRKNMETIEIYKLNGCFIENKMK